MLEKYTVVIREKKTWRGWRRTSESQYYCPTYRDASKECNRKNQDISHTSRGLVRYRIVPIDQI